MGKTLAISLLVFVALILAAVAVQLGGERVAYAQSGRFADYAMVPACTAEDYDAICIIDTVTQRMLFFQYDRSQKKLVVLKDSQADLKKDFRRQ